MEGLISQGLISQGLITGMRGHYRGACGNMFCIYWLKVTKTKRNNKSNSFEYISIHFTCLGGRGGL